MSRRPTSLPPTPWQVQRALEQVRDAMEVLQSDPATADDGLLLRSTIEGETDAFEVIDALVGASFGAEGLAKAARDHARLLSARATRFEKRREFLRQQVLDMMQTMKQERVERADFTVWVRQNAAELIIDTAKLSHAYCHVKLEPDKIAIRKLLDDGVEVEGAQLGNASMGITVKV